MEDTSFYLNLGLLIVFFLNCVIYLVVKIFFTKSYLNAEVYAINSRNGVISNNEVQTIIKHYQVLFSLQNYEISYERTDKFKNFGQNLKRHSKQIILSQRIFESVGYELDYLLASLWFANKQLTKDRYCRVYHFLANHFPIIVITLYLLLFLFELIFFIVVTIKGGTSNMNSGFFIFLWKYPILTILAMLLAFSLVIVLFSLNKMKKNIEEDYTKSVFLEFRNSFVNYADDLAAARTYAQGNKIAYNFAFKPNFVDHDQIKWLGPFVKY